MDKYDEIIQKSLKQQKDYIELREEYNLKILEFLREKINQYPTLRFCQLLYLLNINIEDNFNEESVVTYNNLIMKK